MEKKSNKKFIPWVIAGVILVLAIFAYQEYQKIAAVRNLDVQFVDAKIEKFGWTSLRVGITIAATNPNSIQVTLGAFNAQVYANGIPLTKIGLPEPTIIPADETIQRYFSIELGYLDLGAALVRAFKEGNVNWAVQGQYILQLPFGITYPYTFEIHSNSEITV